MTDNSCTIPSPILFIHIPKAAGTTLTSILDSYYENNEICPAYYMEELLQIPKLQLSSYKLIRGHFEYSVVNLLENPLCMTMLRDPVYRTLSYYKYIRSDKNHILYKKFQSMSIMDILEDPLEAGPVTNHQTLIFGREINLDAMRRCLIENDPVKISEIAEHIVEKDVSFDLARERINDFPFIGITEKFNDSLLLMAYKFRCSPIKKYKNENVTEKSAEEINITPELNKAIVNKNQMDLELYTFANNLFEHQLKKMKEEIASSYSLNELNDLSNDMIIDYLEKRSKKQL